MQGRDCQRRVDIEGRKWVQEGRNKLRAGKGKEGGDMWLGRWKEENMGTFLKKGRVEERKLGKI